VVGFLSRLFGRRAPPSSLRDPRVLRGLASAIRCFQAAQGAAVVARRIVDEVLAAERKQGKIGEEQAKQIAQAIRSAPAVAVPIHALLATVLAVELVTAVADALPPASGEQRTACVAALLALLVGEALPDGVGESSLALAADAEAALLPQGWAGEIRDLRRFRPEGWGLILGNHLAAELLAHDWQLPPRHEPRTELRDLLTAISGPELPPLPSLRLPLPRRDPARWPATVVASGTDLAEATVSTRAADAVPFARAWLEAALSDRWAASLLLEPGSLPAGSGGLGGLPPVTGVALAEFAFRVADEAGEADRPATRSLLQAIAGDSFGLAGPAGEAAMAAWTAAWLDVLAVYDGGKRPADLGSAEGYEVLAFAQTRGRKLAEYFALNLPPAGERLRPPAGEVRALARLWRFAAAVAPDAGKLPPLSPPVPAAGGKAGLAAGLARALALAEGWLEAAGASPSLVERWRRETGLAAAAAGEALLTAPPASTGFARRLALLFGLLERLFPHPEYANFAMIAAYAEHLGVDRPTALERMASSVALVDEAELWLAALTHAALADFGEEERRVTLSLLRECLQPESGSMLKMTPRQDWLASAGEETARLLAAAAAPAASERAAALFAWADRVGGRIAAELDEVLAAGDGAALHALLLYDPERLRREA